jgi:hypothetical protein
MSAFPGIDTRAAGRTEGADDVIAAVGLEGKLARTGVTWIAPPVKPIIAA